MITERQPLTDSEMDEWGQFVEDNTLLSPQESHVFVRLFQQTKGDICEHMSIDKSHLKTVIDRIQMKIGDAQQTAEIGRVLSSRDRIITQPIPFGSALVRCSGPDCDEDVETATVNENFDDFYTKTINTYDNPNKVDNKITLQFCSVECLDGFEELANR